MSDRPLPTYEELCQERFKTILDSGLRDQWQEAITFGQKGPVFSIQDQDYLVITHRLDFERNITLMLAAVSQKPNEISGDLVGL